MKAKLTTKILLILILLSSCGSDTKPTFLIDKKANTTPNHTYYQIFVRSFADSNNDGVGDLNGIRAKLDYLADMGIGGIWLTPIHPSPTYHGYDVDDYYAVAPDLGTMDDFEQLVKEANEKNINIMLDMVFNHSSNRNPWFTTGKANYTLGNYDKNDYTNKANWYNFSGPQNNPSYEAGFGSWMPDFNLANPEVVKELNNVGTYWLNKGVKGFRLDATSHYFTNNTDLSIHFLSKFITHVKNVNPDVYVVAEAWIGRSIYNKYYDSGIDSMFSFATGEVSKEASFIRNVNNRTGRNHAGLLNTIYDDLKRISPSALNATFLSNHDMDRSINALSGKTYLDKAKLAASLYLFLPGTPFIYYGEEIGLKGTRGKAETDANRRLPMIFSEENDEYQTLPNKEHDYDLTKQVSLGSEDNLKDENSLTSHYKRVINMRNHFPFIANANLDNFDLKSTNEAGSNVTNPQLAGLRIYDAENELFIVHNYSEEQQVFLTSSISNQPLEIIANLNYNDSSGFKDKKEKIIIQPYSSIILKESKI